MLLGDTAHAVTPDIGQGACLSIEDAVTLAAAIDALGVDDGLHAYDQARRPRTERLAQASGRLGHLLQTANPVLAGLRDTVAAAAPSTLLLNFAGSAFAWTPPGIPPRQATPDQGATSR